MQTGAMCMVMVITSYEALVSSNLDYSENDSYTGSGLTF
jgi:hypothetical protein